MSAGSAVANGNQTAATTGWYADSLRLTVFPTPDETPAVRDWWEELLEEPPEQVAALPKTGETQLQGTFNRELLVLNAQAMRIDLRHATKPPEHPVPDNRTLGAYEEVREVFRDLVLKGLSLQSFPRIQRLAFGAILLKPVESLRRGYEALSVYLPAVQISTDASDFLYQINRRRPSRAADGIDVNRLSKWSVQTVQGMLVGGDGRVIRKATEFSCRSELDINSAPEHTDELPRDGLQALFGECIDLADEIAMKGDTP